MTPRKWTVEQIAEDIHTSLQAYLCCHDFQCTVVKGRLREIVREIMREDDSGSAPTTPKAIE